MTVELSVLLLLLAIIIILRFVSWFGLKGLNRLAGSSATAVRQIRAREGVAGLSLRFKQAYPKTFRVVKARLTPHHFSGLPLTLMLIAALYIAALFGGLIEELLEAEELVLLDEWLNQQLTVLRTEQLITAFSWLTDLGGSPVLVAVAIVTTGLLWAHRRTSLIAPLWLTIIGSQITTYVGKYVLARPRPEVVTDIVEVTHSFPSGHSTSAMAVYGFLAYIIARDLDTRRRRFEVVYWAAVLICLVGFSRMLLGVHYASDVAAGFLVGIFWLLLGVAIAEHRPAQPG